MKKCPACAERVQLAATKCRYCNTAFSAADVSRAQNEQTIKTAVKVVGVLLILWLLTRSCATVDPLAPPSPAAPVNAAPTLTQADRDKCSKALRRDKSLVWRENRIDVDERKWAETSATDKHAVLALVVCAHFGLRDGEMSSAIMSDQFVVAYGMRSGKRLAMLSGSSGLTLE